MKEFFARDPAKALVEIKEELYGRLDRSRQLRSAYDLVNEKLSGRELGYRTGVNEEIMYLEKLVDTLERS
jgi:hypothetical protein